MEMRKRKRAPLPINAQGYVEYTLDTVIKEVYYPVNSFYPMYLATLPKEERRPEYRPYLILEVNYGTVYVYAAKKPTGEFEEIDRLSCAAFERVAREWNEEYAKYRRR